MRLICLLVALFVVNWAFPQSGMNWQYFGPNQNNYQYKGLFLSVWGDKSDKDILLAGSAASGLYMTRNATSESPSWMNITENITDYHYGVSDIVVINNTGFKKIIISTNTSGGILKHSIGNGLYKTDNGGNSWEQIGPRGKDLYDFPLNGLVANDSDQTQMMAYRNTDLYITDDSWKTWHLCDLPIKKDANKPEICDVYFDPFRKGKIYVCTKTYLKGLAQLMISDDYGKTWQDFTPDGIDAERIAIGFNMQKADRFYIAYGMANYFIRYYDGKKFSDVLNNTPIQHIAGSAYWCFEFQVNEKDTNVLYLASTEVSRSINAGKMFNKIAFYNGSNTHADVRAMKLIYSMPGGGHDRLLLANDGGISESKGFVIPNNLFFNSKNGTGLTANQFWDIDVWKGQTIFVCGGSQDNGGFFMEGEVEVNNLYASGDAYLTLALNDSLALCEGNPPRLLLQNIKAARSMPLPIPDNYCEARRPLLMKDSIIYIGYHDVWRLHYTDAVNGKWNFENISHLPLKNSSKGIQNREIKELAINDFQNALVAYNNPNYDAETNEGKLYYKKNIKNDKEDFVDITTINANSKVELGRWWIAESIVPDNTKKNTFFMIYKDPFTHENSDVYYMEYLPDSNKIDLRNITYNIPKYGLNKLVVDDQIHELFCITNTGIYHKSYNLADTVWKNLKFPFKMPLTDMVIDNYHAKVFVATYGKGIWYADIYSFQFTERIFRKSESFAEPQRVDGTWIIKARRKIKLSGTLVVCANSKIELKRKSSLYLEKGTKVINEKGTNVDVSKYIYLHKGAKVIEN